MGKRLYIGNLSFEVSDEDLGQVFSQYGEVSSAKIIKDQFNGRSKGFGFVEFAQEADAQKALDGMNGKELKGRVIKVDEAREERSREREDRGDRGDRGDRDQRSGGYSSNRRSRF